MDLHEQLTSTLWKQFLGNAVYQVVNLKDRMKSLAGDHRTWSASVCQELLFQVGLLEEETFVLLFKARKARNDLVHSGRTPTKEVVENVYKGLLQLMKKISKVDSLGIENIPLIEDYMKYTKVSSDLDYWMGASYYFEHKPTNDSKT